MGSEMCIRDSLCSSLENKGVTEIWDLIANYVVSQKETGHFGLKRKEQQKKWFLQSLESQLKEHFFQNKKFQKELDKALDQVENHKIAPFYAARQLLDNFQS